MTIQPLKSRLGQLEESIAQKANEERKRYVDDVWSALGDPLDKHVSDGNLRERIGDRINEIMYPNSKAPSKWQDAGVKHRFGAQDRLSRREIAITLYFAKLTREEMAGFHNQFFSALHQALEELLEDGSLRGMIEQECRSSLDTLLNRTRPEQAKAGQ